MNPINLFSHICNFLSIKTPKILIKQSLPNDKLNVVFLSKNSHILIRKNTPFDYQSILQFTVAAFFYYQNINKIAYDIEEALVFSKNYFDKFYQTELIIEDDDKDLLMHIVIK